MYIILPKIYQNAFAAGAPQCSRSRDLLAGLDCHFLAKRGKASMKREEREEKWRLRKGRTGDWPPKGWGGSAVPETRLFYLFILFI